MRTPITNEPRITLRMHPLVPRLLRVVDAQTLAPAMRRIVLSGEDLAQPCPFEPLTVSDHVKVVFPELESGEIHLPTVTDDRLVMPQGRPRPIFRDYTVRSYDAAARRLTLDFVLHDHGVAGRWAQHAATGDPLGVLGPRGSQLYPGDFENYLIAGDETALPAMARWVEELPSGARAQVFISVANPGERIALADRQGIEVTYLDRSAQGPAVLLDAIENFVRPQGELFVWVAGEAAAIKPIRRHVRDVLAIPAEHADIDGYWKQGTAGLDHHEQDDDD
ncbi:siderophore-interacting protein [Arthrobacter sp. HLT1-20]